MRLVNVCKQDQQKQAGEEALREMLKNQTESERDRILQQYQDQIARLNNRLDDGRNQQADKIKAKLAARKRMKEELDKERAVNKELDRITKKHVSIAVYTVYSSVQQCNLSYNSSVHVYINHCLHYETSQYLYPALVCLCSHNLH